MRRHCLIRPNDPRSDATRRPAGSALVIVLLGLLLVSALAVAMLKVSTSDTLASANHRDAAAVAYAAEGALELAADEVIRIADWDSVLSGAVRSVRVDGPPSGPRTLPDGGSVLLDELANRANCLQPGPCTPAQLASASGDRRWGANNPHWRLFAYGNAGGVPPALPAYTFVLVGDDPLEQDGDPNQDAPAGAPGRDLLLLRATAFGPSGSRRTLQATVERFVAGPGIVALRFLTWCGVG
jgi:hypothetical protein